LLRVRRIPCSGSWCAARRCSRSHRSKRLLRQASARRSDGSREPHSRHAPTGSGVRVRRGSEWDQGTTSRASASPLPSSNHGGAWKRPLFNCDRAWPYLQAGCDRRCPDRARCSSPQALLADGLGDASAVVLVQLPAHSPCSAQTFGEGQGIESRRSPSRVNGIASDPSARRALVGPLVGPETGLSKIL
jgi:hypothetical protein